MTEPPWPKTVAANDQSITISESIKDSGREDLFSESEGNKLGDNSPKTERSQPASALWKFICCECKSHEIR